MVAVMYLFRHAFKHKSIVLSILLSIALIQHIYGLVMGSDLVPSSWIVSGCWLLAAVGFWYSDSLVSLAGTYSFISKFNYEPFLNNWWPIHHMEINKAIVAFVVWIVLSLVVEIASYFFFKLRPKSGLYHLYSKLAPQGKSEKLPL